MLSEPITRFNFLFFFFLPELKKKSMAFSYFHVDKKLYK